MPVTIKGVDNFNYILNVGQSFTLDKIEFIDSNKKKIEETNVEDIIEFEGEVVDSIDTNRVGTYKVTTMAKDETGVMSRPIVRHVVVADTLPPTISLIGEELISLRKGEIYLDEGSIAIDNVDGIVYVSGENKVNYNRVGTYEITYYYIDSSGIRSEVITRIIRVEQDYFKLAIYGLLASTITGLLIVFTRKEKQSYKNNLLI